MSLTELLIAHQASTQIRIGCTWPVLSVLQKLSGLPSQPEQLPCGSIMLATHPRIRTSSRSTCHQHPNSYQPKRAAWDNIWFQESLLGGQQLKPEQCNERSGSQRQSEPLIFEGADHVASAVAPIKRDFNQKPTSADPLSTNRVSPDALRKEKHLDGDISRSTEDQLGLASG